LRIKPQPVRETGSSPAIDDVRRYASGRLKAMQRRPRLIAAFWQQAELPL
jgi:hypothetical protein